MEERHQRKNDITIIIIIIIIIREKAEGPRHNRHPCKEAVCDL